MYRSMASSELTEKYFRNNYKIVTLKVDIPKNIRQYDCRLSETKHTTKIGQQIFTDKW